MEDKGTNKILWTVFFTIVIDMMGVGVLIPVFPLLILPSSPFKVTPSSWTLDHGFILLGWLSCSYPLAQFICAPILGQIADRFGRKKTLAISIAGTSFAYILFAIGIITKNIPLMFFSRIIDGATGGNISVAQAVIADISTPKNRAKNFGLVGLSFGVGFIIGPFIGGKLTDTNLVSWFDASTPFYFTALLSLLNVVSVLKLLPETLKVKSIDRLDITKPLSNIAKAFHRPGLRSIMPTTFLFNAGFTFFTTFLAVTLAHKYGFTQSHIGNYFAYVGIMIISAQALFVRRLSGKILDYKVLRFSLFGTSICLFSYFFVSAAHVDLIYLIPPFLSSCNAMTFAFNATLVTRVTPVNMRAESLGINSSVMALAQAIPALLSGYIAELNPTLPILVGSVTVFLGGVCFWILFKPELYPND